MRSRPRRLRLVAASSLGALLIVGAGAPARAEREATGWDAVLEGDEDAKRSIPKVRIDGRRGPRETVEGLRAEWSRELESFEENGRRFDQLRSEVANERALLLELIQRKQIDGTMLPRAQRSQRSGSEPVGDGGRGSRGREDEAREPRAPRRERGGAEADRADGERRATEERPASDERRTYEERRREEEDRLAEEESRRVEAAEAARRKREEAEAERRRKDEERVAAEKARKAEAAARKKEAALLGGSFNQQGDFVDPDLAEAGE